MPFTWQISIYAAPNGKYTYDPPALDQVQVGDQIIWSNKDDQAHWPGLVTQPNDGEPTLNNTYFMPNQIAPHSPSDTFVPGVAGKLTYADSLDPNAITDGPTGTIEVGA